MIPLLGASTITLLRYGAPTVVDFLPVRATPTSSSISATVAPASKKTMQRAPNGVAANQVIDFVTYAEVRGVVEGATPADRLTVAGTTYEVQEVVRQPPFLGQPEHWVGFAVDVQALEVAEPVVP